jgi:hypothetical protein
VDSSGTEYDPEAGFFPFLKGLPSFIDCSDQRSYYQVLILDFDPWS